MNSRMGTSAERCTHDKMSAKKGDLKIINWPLKEDMSLIGSGKQVLPFLPLCYLPFYSSFTQQRFSERSEIASIFIQIDIRNFTNIREVQKYYKNLSMNYFFV